MRLRRWHKLEEARVEEEEGRAQQAGSCPAAAEAGGAEAALSHQEKLARRNQIFNVHEAFAMLSKELSEMMQCPVRPLITWLCPVSFMLVAGFLHGMTQLTYMSLFTSSK